MSILIVTPRLDSNSGWGRYSSSILEEFKRKSVEFEVATLESIASVENKGLVLKPFTPLNFFRNIISLRKVAKKHSIIHAMDGWPGAVYSYGAVLGTNKKLFVNAVGTYALPGSSKIKSWLLGLAYSRSEQVFAISSYTQKRLQEEFRWLKNIEVVHLGATLLPRLSESEKTFLATQLPISGNPVVITVGAIKNRKGQKDTAGALSLLKNRYPDFKYLIVGSTDDTVYINEIKELATRDGIESNIQIIGNAKDDNVLSYLYEKSDLIVLNSRNDDGHFEGFGLVFLEAYQFGLPGVGSADCGIEDAIMVSETGYLSKQGDLNDIADKISLALENKEKLGRNAKALVNKFSWSETAERYLDAYSKSLN